MIPIDIDPNLAVWGTLIISWHGFFSLLAVITALILVARWAPTKNIDPDDIYSIAAWGILGGIIGARIVHVIDNWSYYTNDPYQVIAIWKGGIGIWGAILGGFIGAAIYTKIKNKPVGIIADLTAPALLLAQTIGRLGDIVNGEHCAKATELFFGFIWTSPDSNAAFCSNPTGISVHPVIGYEILWNLSVLFIIWQLKNKISPPGMLFTIYLFLYAIGRFIITFFRDDKVWALGLQEAHFISLLVLLITSIILIMKFKFIPIKERNNMYNQEQNNIKKLSGTRAERRRKK
tara:strand:+ start:27018 stop:27887 length:870 start_codon:yes stop_codon:yes gene_type:complete